MALEIEIDRDVCMGSGNCVYAAEGVFALDDEGIATVLDPAAAPADDVESAAQHCPTGAISVRTTD